MIPFRDGAVVRRFAVLRPHERKLLRLLAAGLSNKEIAYALDIALSTVKGYVSDMLEQLKFDNRVQLARWVLLRPEVITDTGFAVEVFLHLPGCPCDLPRCVAMRAMDVKETEAAA